MEVKTIHWEDALDLRYEVLWPEKDRMFCKVLGDEEALHFGVFIDDKLVSVASLFIENRKVRLRKFATLKSYQRQGVGGLLLRYAISHAKALDADIFWCDARKSAAGFYAKFGLAIEGEAFFKCSVGYYKMSMVFSE